MVNIPAERLWTCDVPARSGGSPRVTIRLKAAEKPITADQYADQSGDVEMRPRIAMSDTPAIAINGERRNMSPDRTKSSTDAGIWPQLRAESAAPVRSGRPVW